MTAASYTFAARVAFPICDWIVHERRRFKTALDPWGAALTWRADLDRHGIEVKIRVVEIMIVEGRRVARTVQA